MLGTHGTFRHDGPSCWQALHDNAFSRRSVPTVVQYALATCSTPCGVHFKLATLMFKSLHGVTVACRLISQMHASRRLSSVAVSARLAPSHALIRSSRTRLGDKSFDVAGPRLRRLWNKLPASLQSFDGLCSEDSWKCICLSRTRLRRLVSDFSNPFRRRI